MNLGQIRQRFYMSEGNGPWREISHASWEKIRILMRSLPAASPPGLRLKRVEEVCECCDPTNVIVTFGSGPKLPF